MTIDNSTLPRAHALSRANGRRAQRLAPAKSLRRAQIYSIPAGAPTDSRKVQNMRVTFWGVQGSCPIFPSPYGFQEYSKRLAIHTLSKAFQHLFTNAHNGNISLEEILGGPPTAANIARFQRMIGLPELPTYGGETTCVEVETSDGNVIILDAGTGLRRCSLRIVERFKHRKDRTLHLFGTHEHLDHRAGMSFARFCYVEPDPFTVHVYGSEFFLKALDIHYGIFSRKFHDSTHLDDPIDYTRIPAIFKGTEFRRAGEPNGRRKLFQHAEIGRTIKVGSTRITPFEVYHVIPKCLGYKIEHNGKTFVFCTDHEMRHGNDPSDPRQVRSDQAEATLREHCQDADLAYFDGQYTLEEYQGQKGIGSFPPTPRIDWGHSCIEDSIDRSRECNIRRTLIGHHDPERAWPDRDAIGRKLSQISRSQRHNPVQLADSDYVVDL
jgi:hypothetical protein